MTEPTLSTNSINRECCIHSNYLFARPLSAEQPLWHRIANVVFHVFTIGIPLAIYHMISCCFPRVASGHEESDLPRKAIKSTQQELIERIEWSHKSRCDISTDYGTSLKPLQPYSKLAHEAIEFARTKLKENPSLIPHTFGIKHQAINPDISLLATYWETLQERLGEKLKKHIESPWSNPEVLAVADEFMKIGFVVSALTLEDLKPFIYKMRQAGENRTDAMALRIQDSYQYRTFFMCTLAYHWIRGELAYRQNEQTVNTTTRIPETHAAPFYSKGTIQNSWNMLYNEYCNRVRMYVVEAELHNADTRHHAWTRLDEHLVTTKPDGTLIQGYTFYAVPDTLPT